MRVWFKKIMTTKSAFIVLTLLAASVSAVGQYKNFIIDESGSGEFLNPSVAVSRRDVKTIVVTAGKDFTYSSKDQGGSWQKITSAQTPGIMSDLSVISDDKGTFYLVYASDSTANGSQIVCRVSRDGGLTWDEGTAFGGTPGKQLRTPSASTDTKGNLLVTWTQYDKFKDTDSLCQSLVMMSTSSSGKKWSKPLQVSQIPGTCRMDNTSLMAPIAAVSPDGKTFVSWYGSGKLFLDRSFGSGLWLENDIAMGTQTEGWQLKVPGHTHATGLSELMVDQSKGEYHGCLYMTWADQRNGENDSDVWFMRSNNHGDNWSSPMRMGTNAIGKQQYAPHMAVDRSNGNIYVAFYDRGDHAGDSTDVYLAYSSTSGAQFKTVKVSESAFTPDEKSPFGLFLDISAHDGVVVPVWSRMDEGKITLMGAVIQQKDLIEAVAVKPKKKK